MLSAPQAIAAMIEVSLPAGFTAPDPTRVDGRSTCLSINSESPVCSANSSTGTRPAADTRFCSSNTADPPVNVCDDCTENAFRYWVIETSTILIVPVQKAFSLFTRRSPHQPIHGFRLSAAWAVAAKSFAGRPTSSARLLETGSCSRTSCWAGRDSSYGREVRGGWFVRVRRVRLHAGRSVQNVSLSGAVPVGIVRDAGNWAKTPQ